VNDPRSSHHRRSIRLRDYDYAQAGAYFVTICAQDRAMLFGEIINDAMVLSEFGRIAHEGWLALPQHFETIELDAFVIMPNHMHGIVLIVDNGSPSVGAKHLPSSFALAQSSAANASPLRRDRDATHHDGTRAGSLSAIVQNYKSVTARKINRLRGLAGRTVWQRNYHEHIIRNQRELEAKRDYIANNPMQWALDAENPDRRQGRAPTVNW
jgi:REP element-mobilizing transposase RayT